MPDTPLRILLLVVISVISSGCPYTNVPLTLPTVALQNTVRGGNGRQVIVVAPFSDERETQRCGMQKDDFNNDTADAVCQSDPKVWLAKLLADELRASGFAVISADAAHRPGALRIEGALQQLFVEPVLDHNARLSLEADLGVTLTATTASGLEARRKFFVKGWKTGVPASTRQPYQTALHRATQQLLEEMVRGVVELMNRYPKLGFQDGDPAQDWVLAQSGDRR